MLLLVLQTFFKINFFKKKKSGNTIRMSNNLEPNQDRGSDLGLNCFQRLSADEKVAASKETFHID